MNSIEYGGVEPIVVTTGTSGQTVQIAALKEDGTAFDWSDNTFKAIGSVVTLKQALTETSPVSLPGVYLLDSVQHPDGFDTANAGLSASTNYRINFQVFVNSSIPSVGQSLFVMALIDGVLERDTVDSRINSMARGKITLSGAAVQPAQDAAYFDESGNLLFTNRNTGDERNPV